MAKEQGITVKKQENFSEWYNQVVQKAELADYSSVKGCMVIRPRAYYIWEKIQEYMNKKIKKVGVKNAYFPLFIPEEFFNKESEHAKGFSPEVYWIEKKEDGVRIAVRPTSETVMYDSYSKWVRSYRDLPLKINQWCNVARLETKTTRLFIRTREFLWQEGHCVYSTKKECDKETLKYLSIYKDLCKELLAIPTPTGFKSDKEKFAGALYTTSIESFMPDGKALQTGTSHNLGQGFAKSFNIKFIGEDEKEHTPWQNSWGVSTRLIGALAMIHGDDKGLVLPPKVADNKVVIIPIIFDKTKEKVESQANKIFKILKKYNPIIDDREGYSAGWKFNEWELKGVPLRIEIGPKDLEKRQVIAVRRDTNEKIPLKITSLVKEIDNLLINIQDNLLRKAEKHLSENIAEAKNWNEFKNAIKNKKLVKVPWCSTIKCEEEIRNKAEGVKSINSPLNQEKLKEKCFNCDNSSESMFYFAKSY